MKRKIRLDNRLIRQRIKNLEVMYSGRVWHAWDRLYNNVITERTPCYEEEYAKHCKEHGIYHRWNDR